MKGISRIKAPLFGRRSVEEPAPWAFGVIQPDSGVPFVRGGSRAKGSAGHAAHRWDNAWGTGDTSIRSSKRQNSCYIQIQKPKLTRTDRGVYIHRLKIVVV